MNREQRRALYPKGKQPKVRVYTMTEAQLEQMKLDCTRKAVDYAFLYLVGMSVKVLHDQFGFRRKSRLPRFADALIDEYERYLDGEASPEEYRDLIYKQCGVKFDFTPDYEKR